MRNLNANSIWFYGGKKAPINQDSCQDSILCKGGKYMHDIMGMYLKSKNLMHRKCLPALIMFLVFQ